MKYTVIVVSRSVEAARRARCGMRIRGVVHPNSPLVAAEALEPVETATTVRVRDGERR